MIRWSTLAAQSPAFAAAVQIPLASSEVTRCPAKLQADAPPGIVPRALGAASELFAQAFGDQIRHELLYPGTEARELFQPG